VDEYAYFRNGLIYLLYTDDLILASRKKSEIRQVIEDIRRSGLKITVEGNVEDFLGVHIQRLEDSKIKMSQPQIARQICQDLGFQENTKAKQIPAASSRILMRHQSSKEFDKSFNYRSVIGKLNYYEKCTRPDISYQTHQCAHFVESTKVEHGEAIRWIGRSYAVPEMTG